MFLIRDPFAPQLKDHVRIGLTIDVHWMKVVGFDNVYSDHNVQGIIRRQALKHFIEQLRLFILLEVKIKYFLPGRIQTADRIPSQCGRLDLLEVAACKSLRIPAISQKMTLQSLLNNEET